MLSYGKVYYGASPNDVIAWFGHCPLMAWCIRHKSFLASMFTSWLCSPLNICSRVSPTGHAHKFLLGPKTLHCVEPVFPFFFFCRCVTNNDAFFFFCTWRHENCNCKTQPAISRRPTRSAAVSSKVYYFSPISSKLCGSPVTHAGLWSVEKTLFVLEFFCCNTASGHHARL